ncbi:arginine--tRNA ligase [Alkalihalobacillus sp. FSL R5-0424]
MIKLKVAAVLTKALDHAFPEEHILSLLETPKHEHLGDVAFPCFTLAKLFKKSPATIATDLKEKLTDPWIDRVEVIGGYLNFFMKQDVASSHILQHVLDANKSYGSMQAKNETIVIDYSSPNIAKPFSMGHLRSTVIGNSLANISEKNGYQVVRVNHLGDWGTQFGKLIVAYKLWGSRKLVEQEPIRQLLELYVRFHAEAKADDSLNDQARSAFKALEDGDTEALELWKWFKEESLKEFKEVYDLLHISFDYELGEAFYNDKMKAVVSELESKKLLTYSQGAYVVELDSMPPCLITKNDGATLYATRDLAAAIYRQETFQAAKAFYVVGNEQALHFQQLFSVLKQMGYKWADHMQHIGFGMMLKDGSKMSTRQGKVVLLAEVLAEAIQLAKDKMRGKHETLEDLETAAKQVGVGAVIFHDLKNLRTHDVEFSLEHMMSFEGDTGPYVQYTCARISTLLRKGSYDYVPNASLQMNGNYEWPVVTLMGQFPSVVEQAFKQADPSQVSKYSLQLARAFNKYYAHTKVLGDDDSKQSKLSFCYAVFIVLKESLELLGIQAPERM